MVNRTLIRLWCFVLWAVVPLTAGFALYVIANNWTMACIKNRQPYAHSWWILTMAMQDLSWTVILWYTGKEGTVSKLLFNAMLGTNLLNYMTYAFFFHRIWMVLYKSLRQKSLTALSFSGGKSAKAIRSSRALSDVLIRLLWYRLGSTTFTAVLWFVLWLIASCLETYFALRCGYKCLETNFFPAYTILNDIIAGSLVVFGLCLLAVQKIFTVSDNFGICKELSLKIFVIAGFFTYSELLMRTTIITSDDRSIYFLLAVTVEILLQIFIATFFIWSITSRPRRIISNWKTVNLDMVLRDQWLFGMFEEQLKREFRVEYLNFLVSCIQYRRIAMLDGDFGIRSSSSSSESDCENIKRLHWRTTLIDEHTDSATVARFIFEEYCQRGSPQEINLYNQTSDNIAVNIRKITNIYMYSKRDIYKEAYDCVYDILSSDSMVRFNRMLLTLTSNSKFRRSYINSDYVKPLI